MPRSSSTLRSPCIDQRIAKRTRINAASELPSRGSPATRPAKAAAGSSSDLMTSTIRPVPTVTTCAPLHGGSCGHATQSRAHRHRMSEKKRRARNIELFHLMLNELPMQ